MAHIYLDYNATAPIRPEVIELITKVMSETGNASSVHNFGRGARKYIEDARAQVAELVNVKPDQVIFTSGATEATNTALFPYKNKTALISSTEHSAVSDRLPNAIRIPVHHDGVINEDKYQSLLENEKPEIVSICLANSETGVIQDIKRLCSMAHKAGALFHTEAVQATGRMKVDMQDLGVDLMSLSAHKMAGPQGVGALIVRKGLETDKFMRGGTQEKNCRAGTHNTAGIAGMGLAAEIAQKELDHYQSHVGALRDDLETKIKSIAPEIIIYGASAPRVCNTSNIGFPGIEAQTQLMALDIEGIAVSSGSACSSGTFQPSSVLIAMGVIEKEASCALRVTLGWDSKASDIDAFIDSWSKIIKRIKKS
ncbi:MAG: cysteine desulfurase family protein [Pseudomonadota bacterium]